MFIFHPVFCSSCPVFIFAVKSSLLLKNNEAMSSVLSYLFEVDHSLRSVVNCCKVLNEQDLFWKNMFWLIISPRVCSREDFQRIPELAINPLGDRIINAFFPEGWVVRVLKILFFAVLCILGLSHNHHKSERGHPAAQLWLPDCRLETLSLFCQFCVWTGVFDHCMFFLYILQLFFCFIWKLKTRCFQMYH